MSASAFSLVGCGLMAAGFLLERSRWAASLIAYSAAAIAFSLALIVLVLA